MKPNILLIMTLTFLTSCASTKSIYRKEVAQRSEQPKPTPQIITKANLDTLPKPVANYLLYCGWLGQNIPTHFSAQMSGDFSLKRGKYMKVKMKQNNWMDEPTRIFHISNWMIGGRHHYDKNGAFMLIKLLKRFKVVNAGGEIMNQSELVTYLNDLLIFAPGAVLIAPIEWETIDDYRVNATITYFGKQISAELIFNEKYELINFISHDRYASKDGKDAEKIPWSTPIDHYQDINGIKVPASGMAIWHYPDYDYPYIKMNINGVQWRH